jgi:hypothetical protein
MPFIPPGSGYLGLTRITGYRPVEVTLVFKDGSKAVPDSLGTPVIGTVYAVEKEILTRADVSSSIRLEGANPASTSQSKTNTSTSPIQAFVTAERPILQSARGAAIRLYWHTPGDPIPSTGDVPISPGKITVDSQQGIVEVAEASPNGKMDCVAYYYSEVTEKSSLLLAGSWADNVTNLNLATSGFSTDLGLSAVYPVTRNKTDYVYGRPVELRPPNMDRSSPDYYPVYEYKIERDGSLKFSVPLHAFSDSPAKIIVKYKTLGIEPRIIVDLFREADVGLSPELPPLKIAVETITS